MSDAPPEVRAEHTAAGLTPGEIDRVLADFRGWLEELAVGQPAVAGRSEAIDLFTLVAQFTALRHEVNLQTKAVRAAVEQNARLIDRPPAPDDALRPLVAAVIDVADALTTAHRQVEKARAAAEPLLAALAAPPRPPGPFARLLGAAAPPDRARPAADRLRPVLAGVADGYALSLRRVERVLPLFGLEPIPPAGRPFDPDTMEVVELGDGGPPGTVLEEVRRGYRWNGTVFRFAQVKVAR